MAEKDNNLLVGGEFNNILCQMLTSVRLFLSNSSNYYLKIDLKISDLLLETYIFIHGTDSLDDMVDLFSGHRLVSKNLLLLNFLSLNLKT